MPYEIGACVAVSCLDVSVWRKGMQPSKRCVPLRWCAPQTLSWKSKDKPRDWREISSKLVPEEHYRVLVDVATWYRQWLMTPSPWSCWLNTPSSTQVFGFTWQSFVFCYCTSEKQHQISVGQCSMTERHPLFDNWCIADQSQPWVPQTHLNNSSFRDL